MFPELFMLVQGASWPEPPWPDTAMKELDSCGFLPSMQTENVDQGLDNSSHRGKYIGLHSPLGAASSGWVNVSDRQSLLHTYSVHAHKHAVKQATGSNEPAQSLFPYYHARTNCFLSFSRNKALIVCQMWLHLHLCASRCFASKCFIGIPNSFICRR